MPGPREALQRPFERVAHLGDHLLEIGELLARAPGWALFLDFDGTLSPLAPRPSEARLPEATRACLDRLSRRREGVVALLSGRSLSDLKSRVGLPGLYYAGNHGLELQGPGGLWFEEPTAARLRPRLASLTSQLERELAAIPGVEVEPKGLTTAIHDRRVPEAYRPLVTSGVTTVLAPKDPDFKLAPGKRVVEIRPRLDWGKAQAALWLLEHLGCSTALPLFLGDDETDEEAFRVLSERGITARVGPFSATRANSRLDGPEQVLEFLCWFEGRAEA